MFVISGFGINGWEGKEYNASGDVATTMGSDLTAKLKDLGITLDVQSPLDVLKEGVDRALAKEKEIAKKKGISIALWLALGVDAGEGNPLNANNQIRIENSAQNLLETKTSKGPIVAGGKGPIEQPATIQGSVFRFGIPQEGPAKPTSKSAGTYFCNYMNYRLIESMRTGGPGEIDYGQFVHIPNYDERTDLSKPGAKKVISTLESAVMWVGHLDAALAWAGQQLAEAEASALKYIGNAIKDAFKSL
jgi:hypothetical protein